MYNEVDKLALITGASGGIGSALAEELFQSGYKLALHYNQNRDACEALYEKLALSNINSFKQTVEIKDQIKIFRADLSQTNAGVGLIEEIENAFSYKPNILIHNAGQAEYSLLDDLSLDRYRELERIFLENPIFMTKTCLSRMKSSGFGRILFISSIWGLCGSACESIYSSLKAAQHGFTKALAKELASCNITVNALACGVVNTKMNDFPEEELQELKSKIPMGRFAETSEIAKISSFLLKEEASYLSGQIISPNGALI